MEDLSQYRHVDAESESEELLRLKREKEEQKQELSDIRKMVADLQAQLSAQGGAAQPGVVLTNVHLPTVDSTVPTYQSAEAVSTQLGHVTPPADPQDNDVPMMDEDLEDKFKSPPLQRMRVAVESLVEDLASISIPRMPNFVGENTQ